jgi:hypothetical protein
MSYADGLKTPKHNSQTVIAPDLNTANTAGVKKPSTKNGNIMRVKPSKKRRMG